MENGFIEKAKLVHGDKYDYSKVAYSGNEAKVCIICPIHGEFWQTPHSHLQGHGCKKCGHEKSSSERSLTTEEFIKRAKEVHGDKYDYSKVEYINSHTKVCIICPEYGEFWQSPASHLKGGGHPNEIGKKVWGKRKKMTTEEFIKKAKEVHGDKYDCSKIEYVNATTKICVGCKIHGFFKINPYNFLNGKGCKECGRKSSSLKQSLTTEEFIKRAKEVHGDKYDYSKVEYINNHAKVCIICPIHGEFWQTPLTHLRGSGCKKDGILKTANENSLTTEEFIERAKKVHGDKYDYSKANYVNSAEKVCIICPIHGEFWQTPENHLCGKGCKECGRKSSSLKQSLTTEEFIKKAKEVHGDKYDYSKVNYVKAKNKVCIICREHGEFWQTPENHLNGNGCPICKSSKLEIEIKNFLMENNINHIYQYRNKWLGKQSLDFYLPDHSMAIECQGIQHFEPISFSGKKTEKDIYENFSKIKKLDSLKKEACEKNGLKLLYYSNLSINYPYRVYNNKRELLNEILS